MLEKLEEYTKTWRDIENYRVQYGALTFRFNEQLINCDKATKYWEDMWNKFRELNNKVSKEQDPILWRPANSNMCLI